MCESENQVSLNGAHYLGVKTLSAGLAAAKEKPYAMNAVQQLAGSVVIHTTRLLAKWVVKQDYFYII